MPRQSQLDCPCRADFDTLGPASAEVTMIGMVPKNSQGMERAFLRSLSWPGELLSLNFGRDLFPLNAFHLLALAADCRRIGACVEIVLLDVDGRLLRIHDSKMEQRTNRFTKMAAAAFFLVHLDSHLKARVSLEWFFGGSPVRPTHALHNTRPASC